ncbi:glucosamine inositolphosphorylceramide transferase family protein [Sphingomonas sp. HMP9]|uniref:glucosamine inositolphosphorylceramide transferase family protein n=1 Tax=Sphingomonas sp. HMP9 TaxID=1517554 RepID=UPI001596C67F|nr:formyl transferase [Sphingomonas sp. HMP9]
MTTRSLEGFAFDWIPGSSNLRYLADPFGLWRDGQLYVFTEWFDYRDSVGRIAVSVYDAALTLVEQTVVLREPWHLSYPFVFEAEGETWLLPESFQSGGLWLYRAVSFPYRWERTVKITLDHVPLDATPFYDGERWWLFYSPAFPPAARLVQLCAAYADRIEGPWQSYIANPFFTDLHGARPGGTPIWHRGNLYLPVQGCTGTYGAAVRLLRIDKLAPDNIVAAFVNEMSAPLAATPFTDGCHTLAAVGPVTLIDVKQTRFLVGALASRPLRELYRRRQASQPYRW